jgi:uncharacterized phage-associated protein
MSEQTADRRYDGDTPPYAAPLVGFRSRKAAHLAAFFLAKSGGQIDKLKLIKLLYLTERAFLADHELPMLCDELYSLPHGPICSSSLNAIDGKIHQDIWDEYLTRHGRDKVFATRKFAREDLDELSEVEMEAAEATWSQFGHMTAWTIRNWTHDHCPEYTETAKGRIPISYQQLLEALGDANAADIEREINSLRRAESALQF